MLVLGALAAFGQVDIIVLAILSLMQGALDGAHTPVRMTIVPNLVDRDQLQSAIASTSISLFNVSRFVGPAIAGLIIATFGVGAAFAVNGISYLAIIAAVSVVRMDGVRYVLDHHTIRGLLIIIAVASILGRGALEMLPAFADAVFQRGSVGLAILTSALGVGAVATGLVLTRSTKWLNSNVIRVSVIAAGILIAFFGANSTFWLAVAVVTVLGVILSLGGVGSQILIQGLVDEDVRGRVSSLWGMIAFGGTALGSLVVGSASAAFGLQGTVVITGLLCGAAAFFSPMRKS
jgi:predicted MFS family arabinose efflux permease